MSGSARSGGAPTLRNVISRLGRYYGPPPRPFPTGAFQQILWENVAYLAPDARRAAAFKTLRQEVGLTPAAVLHAPIAALRRVASHGILPDKFAGKLREAARIALDEFDGDVETVLDLPLAQAKRALRSFPGIGEPGAEKILLFSGRHALLAPDSNALRVLQRLDVSPARKTYASAYAAACEVSAEQLGADTAGMLRAHQLLRRHGQELCTRSAPACPRCPIVASCPRIGVAG